MDDAAKLTDWTKCIFHTDILPEPYIIHVRSDGYQCREIAGGIWIITTGEDPTKALAEFADGQSAMDYWDTMHVIEGLRHD